jgi:hypothetical protein
MRIHGREFDELTGTETVYGSEDGKMIVKTMQDVEPSLDALRERRNDPQFAKDGIKRNFQFCVHIPDSVGMKMRTEDGFDMWQASAKELREFIVKRRDKYGYLFATAGKV